MTSIDLGQLLESGTHKQCPDCQFRIIPISARSCSQCAAGLAAPLSAPPSRRRTMARGGGRKVAATVRHLGDGSRTGAGTVAPDFRGGLDAATGGVFWLVAHGVPVTQGSMVAVAAGKIRRDNGPELVAWRDEITRRARLQAGSGWTPINGPVQVAACLTVPWPARMPFSGFCEAIDAVGDTPARLAPMGTPDGDKLLRAVQDALSPRGANRFHLLEDDARVIDSQVSKTFPAPEHTHPWALDTPGLVLRVSILGADVAPMPGSSLSDPGGLPDPALRLHRSLARQTR
ncbi:RusA family crossover junction endodeoxyribonuclease [Dietzia cinnamea]|uniref:RusA family crossover junction endodeoxyribonuclease n=1 Tax=Dietzia cinnamea TaxID=321318 RepID=UPI00223B2479|nr:RusA family crossover junction endodeoxyribonuclease [Dietzia cinnamea]MCT2299552.1 RusA family crossover junction endodeoxyribonuclease [Dietzia cinnamea]